MKIGALQTNPALLSNAENIAAPSVSKAMNMEQIDAAARDFESMFVSEMLKPMFDTVDIDKNFSGGKGEEMFKSFLLDEYGKQVSSSSGIGIAQQVKEELIAMQSRADEGKLAQNMHGNSKAPKGESHVR